MFTRSGGPGFAGGLPGSPFGSPSQTVREVVHSASNSCQQALDRLSAVEEAARWCADRDVETLTSEIERLTEEIDAACQRTTSLQQRLYVLQIAFAEKNTPRELGLMPGFGP